MKAIFFVTGPDIRHGVALEPFENVNLYPLIAWILGLDITNLKQVRSMENSACWTDP